MGISATIGAAFGCPVEGEVSVASLRDIAAEVASHTPDEIALADTIGVASPADVVARLTAVAKVAPGIRRRAHFHNTRNTGIANADAALQCGVSALDASIGGLGGCPFAPAATGNIPTEDLCHMLQRMGLALDIELASLIDTAAWMQGVIAIRWPPCLAAPGWCRNGAPMARRPGIDERAPCHKGQSERCFFSAKGTRNFAHGVSASAASLST